MALTRPTPKFSQVDFPASSGPLRDATRMGGWGASYARMSNLCALELDSEALRVLSEPNPASPWGIPSSSTLESQLGP